MTRKNKNTEKKFVIYKNECVCCKKTVEENMYSCKWQWNESEKVVIEENNKKGETFEKK